VRQNGAVRCVAWLLLVVLAGCTSGAPPGGGGTVSGTTLIDVSLSSSPVTSTPYGTSTGYAPAVTMVSVGASVQFVNHDSFAHTATSVTGTTFPADPGFTSSALTASGTRLSTGWTSGSLGPGAASPVLLADTAGTYLFGCFYHYGGGMRGAIVVH
jgi:plastocyanin